MMRFIKRFIRKASEETVAIINPLQGFGRGLCVYLRTLLSGNSPKRSNDFKERSLVTLVEKARIEWEQAKVFFNEAKDPALIDHAVYAMDAAERKYIYLLKEARKEKVVHEDFYYFLNNNVL